VLELLVLELLVLELLVLELVVLESLVLELLGFSCWVSVRNSESAVASLRHQSRRA